jgi:hypothetical protein
MKIKNYTQEDFDYILNNFSTMKIKDIALHLNKTESSIANACRKLGLKKQYHSAWTDEEKQYLFDHFYDDTSEQIAKVLNKTVNAVNGQRSKLGLVRNPEWPDEDVKFLKDHYQTMEYKEIGEILQKSEGAVRAKCFDLGLNKIPNWTDEEIEFLKENYTKLSFSELKELLIPKSDESIRIKANRMGLKKSPYYCDYHYFDSVDTEEKAYWLGFLTADGWINYNTRTKSGTVGVELQYGDIEHLKKFNKSLNGNYKITDRWRECTLSKSDKLFHYCCIRIFSVTMYDSLCKLGFTNNKSFEAYIPSDIPDDLLRHYIRGYYDGNGTLSVSNNGICVKITTASARFKDDYINVLNHENIKVSPYQYINEYGTEMYAPSISTRSNQIKFLDYIYKNCTIYLTRKYKKYLKAKRIFDPNDGLAA